LWVVITFCYTLLNIYITQFYTIYANVKEHRSTLWFLNQDAPFCITQ